VIGHSLGGAVVTLVKSRATINIDQPLQLTELGAVMRAAEPQLRNDFTAVFTAMMDALAGSRLPGDLRQELTRYHVAADKDVTLAIWEPLLSGHVEELQRVIESSLRAMTAPYLSLHGSDPGDDYRQWLKRHAPTATLEVWPGAGHWLHRVEPVRFAARAIEFFERARTQNP
jgi:pimeloyl-ACP methyl ester carboxylesterase